MKVSYYRKEAGNPIIGVLALQGNFKSHSDHLALLNIESVEIRRITELENIDALIIPGGESTTILKFFEKAPWKEKIKLFAEDRPVFGTCAGAILLSKYVSNPRQDSLDLIPISIIRNAYGRQKESFYAEIDSRLPENEKIKCYFIRAPIIDNILDPEVQVIAEYNNDPVLIRYRNILCSTFHPELSDDLKVHKYFLNMIKCMNLV